MIWLGDLKNEIAQKREVQNISNFEETLNFYRSEGGYSIFITDSNSYLLSGEIATKLTGRYIEFEIFPYSFKVRGTANTAVDQIRDRRYFAGLERFEDNTLLIGVSYDMETKKHECLIEKAWAMSESLTDRTGPRHKREVITWKIKIQI